jgi:mono/diheme cytochrome c family protein
MTTGPGVELDGEQLFTLLCAACHGTEGQGSDLGYELRHHTPEHFDWVVRNGRPGTGFDMSEMTAFGPDVLSDADAAKILDYLDSFPQPDTGEGLYLDYCGNCHGPTAQGGVTGVDIAGKGFGDVSEKVREGVDLNNVGAQDLYMPRFDTDRITDEELQLIVDFI